MKLLKIEDFLVLSYYLNFSSELSLLNHVAEANLKTSQCLLDDDSDDATCGFLKLLSLLLLLPLIQSVILPLIGGFPSFRSSAC